MIWGKTYKQQQEERDRKNANWFAWHPVHLEDGRWCWLERVKRNYWHSYGNSGWEYYAK